MRPLNPVFIRLLPAFIFLLIALKTNAQIAPCGSDQIHEELRSVDPVFAQRTTDGNAKYLQFLAEKAAKKGGPNKSMTSSTYTIPVVVHVIYTSSTAVNNISDAQVQSAIQRLNEQYANAFGTSVDTKIQFQLATMDANCNPTTGILHVSGAGVANYTNHGIDSEVVDSDGIGASMSGIFSLSRWDPDLYMNIYVVSEIANNDGGYGTQAYAFYPTASDTYHGVVIMYNTIGYDYNNCGCYQLKSYTDENETLAHEVGHYFYLKHTFEGGSSSTCPSTSDTAGDGVADTPAHKYITTCPTSGGNTCYSSSDPYYNWDLIIHNYMGYWGESCTDEFTQGQADRMAWAIETYKPGLLYSPGLQTTSVSMTAAACTPQTTTGLGGEYGLGPIEVTIGDMVASSNSAYKDGGYFSRSCFSSTLEINQTYPVEVTMWGNYTEDVRVYIDWDNDGSMTSSELVFSGDNAESFSGTFTVPTTAVTGQWLRARVISDVASNNITSSCYAPEYGQVEDYPVYVKNLNPTLTSTASTLSDFLAQTSFSSAPQNFKISGTDLFNNVSITCSTSDYELSSDGSSYASTLSFAPSNLVLSEKTVYVRLKTGLTAGSKSATLTVSHTGATSKTVSLSGEVGEVSKLRGNCASFDGSGDYFSTSFAISGGQSRTCEAWVKTTANNAPILSFGSLSNYKKWTLRTDGNGRLRIEIENAYKVSTNTITDGNWHHVAVVLNNASGATLANTTLYIDGMAETPYDVLNGTQTINTDAGTAMTIGKDANSRYFTGEIDELRIWTTARSATEIRSNMHLTLDGTETGLAAYYQFNESSGTAKEWVGGYKGILNGNATYATSGINCGKNGTSQNISVNSTGTANFSSAGFSMNFTSKTGASDFTVTQEEFAPNSTSGLSGRTFYQNPMWTLNQSASLAFTANLSFSYDASTFTDLDANNYSLYHRTMGSSGTWTKLVDGAAAITATSITFNGVAQTGQFLFVKDQITPEKVRGNALSLDGNGDYLAPAIALTSSYTKEAWVKYEGSSSGTGNIISSTSGTNGHAFWITGGKLAAGHNGNWNYVQDTESFPIGEWVHVAVTYSSGGEMKLYKNGILVASATGVPAHGGVNCYVGRFSTGYYFQGKMDEVRLWGRVRTAQEIRENMHLTLDGKQSDLSLYYQFNDSGSTVYTKYGTNDATLQGNASLVASTVNCGREGTSQTIANIVSTGEKAFSSAHMSIDFLQKNSSDDFTATYQQFTPNSTSGTGDASAFNNPVWTVNRSSGGSFLGNFTFTFPDNTLTETDPLNYSLYHRSMGEDGDWELLDEFGDELVGNSITFDSISVAGQFMVAQTGVSTERGHALQLDGVDDELRSNLDFDPLQQPFTIELWAKLEGNSQIVQTILEKSRSDHKSYLLLITLQNRLWVYFGNRLIETKSATLLDRNDWHHIAFVWDLQTAKLYLNGLVIAESEITDIPSNTNPLNIGTQYRNRYHFSGLLDELRYWPEARSQQEILEGMHLTSLAKFSNDVYYYQLNRSASDFSGLANLTLVGNPSYTNSGVNVCDDGDVQTIQDITTVGIYDFENVMLSMDMTEVEDSLSFTTVYQAISPNTTQGIADSYIFNTPMWTLHECTGHHFTADMSFIFPADSFTDLTANKYQLYHRSAGGDGNWTLLVNGAASVSSDRIIFSGISEVGQFMVAKTLTP